MSLQKMSEGIHYVLEPTDDDNEQGWNVRINERFPETVIRFGNVAFNEEKDCLTFNYVVLSSPDTDLTEDNEELQLCAGDILENILENAIKDNALVVNERDTDTP